MVHRIDIHFSEITRVPLHDALRVDIRFDSDVGYVACDVSNTHGQKVFVDFVEAEGNASRKACSQG